MVAEPPELLVADVDAWRAWVLEHQDDPVGVRLVLAKKGQDAPTTLTYAEALQEALCVGWIDGQANRRDDATFLQKFTPRRSRSLWSKRNVGYVADLIEQGRMQPRGLAEVARAQADGRWDAAYAGPATIEVPPELTAALAEEPAAAAFWEVLSSQNRFAFLQRIHTAVRPDTKTRRIEQFVAMMARGETFYPQKATLVPEPSTEDPESKR
ncbi:MAG: YdeI/OmpD-associated family protein [Propionibacteriaceae bacterium]